MTYGTLKIDTITFTDDGIDKSVSVSGLVQNPSFSGNITATGTISGNIVRGQTISGITVTGTTAAFTSGTFISLTGTTTQGTTAAYTTGSFTSLTGTTISGTTAIYTTGTFTSLTGTTTTGTTANFVSGVFSTQISGATITGTTAAFTTVTGGVATITSGVFALGTNSLPSISFSSDPNTGIYSPGADQVAISTNGTQRINIEADYVRLASGSGGIQFNGDTAAANALDDYEEGNWTCRFYSGTTVVAEANAYGFSGRYVKIGRLVHIIAGGRFQVLNTTAGPYYMNLPFVPSSYGSVNETARLPIGTIRTMAAQRGWPAATRFYVAATRDANNRHKIGGSNGDVFGTSAPSFTSTGDLDLFIEFTYQI